MTATGQSLTGWDRSQAEQLDRLKNAAERDVVLRLLETSCLLELAKLAPAKMDLPSFGQTVVDVLTQFIPVDGCLISIRPPGLPEVRASFGRISDDVRRAVAAGNPEQAPPSASVFALGSEAAPAGVLVVEGMPEFLGESTLFSRAAELLSTTLQSVVDAERLRRQAAVANATRLATAFDGPCTSASLGELANALLQVPGVVGADLRLEGPSVADPPAAQAGTLAEPALRSGTEPALRSGTEPSLRSGTEPATEHRCDVDSGPVRGDAIVGRVSWTAPPSVEDWQAIDDVLVALGMSIERTQRNRRLEEEAEIDALTGVGNRRRAEKAIEASLNLAGRHGDPVALLFLDLDHFKQINDTLGHVVGDRVLVAFAKMLEAEARTYDVVARVGGDEFLVVCPSTGGAGARTLAERVRKATPATCGQVLPSGWHQTLSVGISLFPFSAEEAAELLRRADGALYEAKAAGRDAVAVADGLA